MNEKVKARAVIATQLPQEVMAKVVKKLEAADRAELMMQMSSVKSLDPTMLTATAERLSIAARKLPKIKNIEASGMALTGNMMDELSDAEQMVVLRTIRSSQPDTYLTIRENTILWQDITRIDASELGSVLIDLEPGDIAKAIHSSVDEEQMHVLSSLPAGFKSRISSQLSSINEDDAESITQARSRITKALRSGVVEGLISKSKMKPLVGSNEQ